MGINVGSVEIPGRKGCDKRHQQQHNSNNNRPDLSEQYCTPSAKPELLLVRVNQVDYICFTSLRHRAAQI